MNGRVMLFQNMWHLINLIDKWCIEGYIEGYKIFHRVQFHLTNILIIKFQMNTTPPEYVEFVKSLVHSIIESSGGLIKPSVGSIRTATKDPHKLAEFTQMYFGDLPVYRDFKGRGGTVKFICNGDRLEWMVHV